MRICIFYKNKSAELVVIPECASDRDALQMLSKYRLSRLEYGTFRGTSYDANFIDGSLQLRLVKRNKPTSPETREGKG